MKRRRLTVKERNKLDSERSCFVLLSAPLDCTQLLPIEKEHTQRHTAQVTYNADNSHIVLYFTALALCLNIPWWAEQELKSRNTYVTGWRCPSQTLSGYAKWKSWGFTAYLSCVWEVYSTISKKQNLSRESRFFCCCLQARSSHQSNTVGGENADRNARLCHWACCLKLHSMTRVLGRAAILMYGLFLCELPKLSLEKRRHFQISDTIC